MNILAEILSIIASIATTPFAMQAITCVESGLVSGGGWQAVLDCILGLATATPAEAVAKNHINRALSFHLKVNPKAGQKAA